MGRDWYFSNARSQLLESYEGPLKIDLENHDVAGFMSKRARLIAEDIMSPLVSKL
jgi:hypothetical protein